MAQARGWGPQMDRGVPGDLRTKTTPISVPRTTRVLNHRVLTSFNAGYAVPVLAVPLLREDQATRIDLTLAFEMGETVEMLVNAVYARALAYLVPFSAFPRFNGMDQFNRSYMKQPEIDGGAVQSFIATAAFADTMAVFKKMGIHARTGQTVNIGYIEAYNEIFNFRARNRSPDLTLRAGSDPTLAPAFWTHQLWANTVPDFDQASIEGEVPLTIVNPTLNVRGLGYLNSSVGTVPGSNVSVRETGQAAATTFAKAHVVDPSAAAGADAKASLRVREDPAKVGWPQIQAELAENGITVSLANIEMARKTQAFAMLRKQYNGLEDDYIMDLLMNGITVPDQDLRQPILLADRSVTFGMAKRYATDSTDLTASVTNGGTFIDLRLRTPQIHTGGIVMVIVEVLPEQLFERQADIYLSTLDQANYPEYIRDTLDPEKVDIVSNQDVDVHHDTPNGTFGYTYMNAKWARSKARVGGKFYRPDPDGAFDEDRQRIWAVETANPTLSADFYLAGTVNKKPFVDTASDSFEVTLTGASVITGLTVFGRPLIEASDDYDWTMAQAPDDPTIDKPVTFTAPQAKEAVTGPESAAEAGGTAASAE